MLAQRLPSVRSVRPDVTLREASIVSETYKTLGVQAVEVLWSESCLQEAWLAENYKRLRNVLHFLRPPEEIATSW